MRTVFFDVDTQLDFLYPAGALYVPGADELVGSFAELTRYASSHHIQIISSADAHSEDDEEFQTWKPHCVVGTFGQQKAGPTLLNNPVVLRTGDGAWEQIRSRISDARQIVVEKQKLDAFSNPHLRSLLGSLEADRYVLYGVVTELCVRCAALGLLETEARVELVSDAIKSLKESEGRDFVDRFRAQGGRLTTVSALIS